MLSVLCFVLLFPCLSPSLFPSSPNRSLRCVQAVGFHCFSDRARRKSLLTMCSLFIFLTFSLFLSNSLALLFGHASAQHCMAFRSGKITHSLSLSRPHQTLSLLDCCCQHCTRKITSRRVVLGGWRFGKKNQRMRRA